MGAKINIHAKKIQSRIWIKSAILGEKSYKGKAWNFGKCNAPATQNWLHSAAAKLIYDSEDIHSMTALGNLRNTISWSGNNQK